MLHHLYGILERPPVASRLPELGVDERPVFVRRIGGLVVLSTLLDAAPRATPAARRRHHDVLQAASTPGPMFPLPYGVHVSSGELEAWVAVRVPRIRAGLRAVRGKVEMHVSVLPLHFGQADVSCVGEVADRVATAAGVATWRGRASGSGANIAVSLAFLLARADVAGFFARIAPVLSRAGDVAVVPNGPWPALTFVPALDAPAPSLAEPLAVPYAV